MKYGIGLDIGIASVGFAVVRLDDDENPYGIIRMGSRIFTEAEHPKDGSSLALPRREARSTRRRLRRVRHRKERIRQLLLSGGILTQIELDALHDNKNLEDIYALRTRALDAPLPIQSLHIFLSTLHSAAGLNQTANRMRPTKKTASC